MYTVCFSVYTGYLAATPLAVWVWRGMLVQDLDAVPKAHPIEMVPRYASGAGRP